MTELQTVDNSWMSINWKRGPKENFDFTKVLRWAILGIVGCGKSSFLERIGELNLLYGNNVLDIYASKDGENLAWLRSDWVQKQNKSVLLLHGEGVDIKSEYDTKLASKISLRDLEKYDIIISSNPLYMSSDQEYREITNVIEKIRNRRTYKKINCGIIREASNLLYSRIKVSMDQTHTKNRIVYALRESRHSGLGLVLDSLRVKSIDVDARITYDYEVIKSLGIPGLTKEMDWLYSYFRPAFIRNMPEDAFIILSKRGGIGIGCFREVLWHKQEKEDILKAVNVKVEYGEAEPISSQNMTTYKTISDVEHSEIMELFFGEGQSMGKIEKLKKRSKSTISKHIKDHRDSILRSGFCPSCKRVNGKYFTTKERGE